MSSNRNLIRQNLDIKVNNLRPEVLIKSLVLVFLSLLEVYLFDFRITCDDR